MPLDTVAADAEQDLLRRYWYAAATSASLEAGPAAVTILGEQVMVARVDGAAIAALDRCPHRGAELSSGWVRKAPEGGDLSPGAECLVCPYHGVHFDRRGRAVHLPARPGERLPERVDLPLLNCREHNGLVWVSFDPSPIAEPPRWQAFDQPELAQFQLEPEVWSAMPSRIIENFNDIAHLGIVHVATFGVPVPGGIPRQEFAVSDATNGGPAITHELQLPQLDRQTIDGPDELIYATYRYDHYMPFSSELRIDFDADRTEWIQISVTPISPTSSLVFQQNLRNFERDGDIDGWAAFQAAVNTEDRVLLETVRPSRIALDGSNSSEVALSPDGFTTAYRQIWRTLLTEPPH